MDKDEYKKLVKEYTPKENKMRNAIIAFVVGGGISFVGQLIASFMQVTFGMEVSESYVWLCILTIFIASFLTALGFFDNFVSKCGCGLIIPTTGFAHSMTSSALDVKKDGLITGLGASFFKLAGSVLLYGILAGFFFSILGVIIYG